MTRDKVVEILENHKHYLQQDCPGWEQMRGDFHNQDLSGLDLRGLSFAGTDCRNVNLERAQLRNVDFSGADLENANLMGVRGDYANFNGANMAGVLLYDAHLVGAKFTDVDFQNVDLAKFAVPSSRLMLDEADFTGADLRGASLAYMDLEGATFDAAKIEGADFSGANCRRTSFRGVEVQDALFKNTHLEGAFFDGQPSDLAGINEEQRHEAKFFKDGKEWTQYESAQTSRQTMAPEKKDDDFYHKDGDAVNKAAGRRLPDVSDNTDMSMDKSDFLMDLE